MGKGNLMDLVDSVSKPVGTLGESGFWGVPDLYFPQRFSPPSVTALRWANLFKKRKKFRKSGKGRPCP